MCVCVLAELAGSPNLALHSKSKLSKKSTRVDLHLRFGYPCSSLLIDETERFNTWMNHIRCLSGSRSCSVLSLSHISATHILAPTFIQVINRGQDQGVPDCLISCHSGCSSSPQLEAERKVFLGRWWGMKGWLAGWRVQLPVWGWIREEVEEAQMVLLFTILNIHPSVVFLNPLKRTPPPPWVLAFCQKHNHSDSYSLCLLSIAEFAGMNLFAQWLQNNAMKISPERRGEWVSLATFHFP